MTASNKHFELINHNIGTKVHVDSAKSIELEIPGSRINMASTATAEEDTTLSKQYDTPLGLAHDTMQALKDRIKLHYDLASEYYLNLWYVMLQASRMPAQ